MLCRTASHCSRNDRNCCCCSSPEFTKEVTFAEFVCYVLRANKYKIETNRHWRPQHENCRPCSIKYDSIAYYETLRDDAEYILTKIAAGPHISLVPRSKDTLQASSDDYLQLYDAVPVNDIRGLLDFYKNDYYIFGYQIQDRIRSRLQQEDQHPLTGQRAANFRLLANQ